MDFASSDFLTQLLQFFEMHCITGFLALQPYAWQLCSVLAIIDIGTTWALYSGEVRMSELISRVMKVGFFLFLILNWDKINSAILLSFQYAGLTAAGVTPSGDWIAPSKLLQQGFDVVGELLKGFQETSIMSGGGLGKCFMYLLSTVITLAAFFFLTLQILLTKIEFNVFASVGIILLPFGAIRFTSFLFQRTVSAVFSFGVKLMVMYFLIALFNSLAGDVQKIPADASFAEMLRLSLSYAAMAFLAWQLPNKASSLMSGMPSMDAGEAVRGARMAGAAAVGAATGGVGGVVAKAASTFGNAKATMAAARASAGAGAGKWGMAKSFAGTMAGQRFANSTIGRGIVRGANNAMNHNKNFNRIRSGEVYTTPEENRNDYDGK
ncbi:MAG: P-type conjugative transfer protein TrbL [Selenomonadaceae bacterium]|nr:P-type conjugative transfer protein TrbL [Selenomonadaceae bacterium]